MKKFYTCKYDRPFKEIMLKEKNIDILKWLLETTLKETITDIKIKTVERNSENIHIKRKIFDALLTTNIGKVQIEVNSNIENYVHPRSMAYITDTYSHDTLVGEIYTEDTKFIQINLTYGLKDKKGLRIYKVRDEEGKLFVNNFIIYEYNMDFYKKLWLNKEKKEIKENEALIMLDLELKDLKELSKENRLVNKYMKELEKINKDPEFREYMTLDEDYRKIRNSILHEEKEKSREEGLKEGLKEQAIIIVKTMLKKGYKIEEISEITGFSKEDINELK